MIVGQWMRAPSHDMGDWGAPGWLRAFIEVETGNLKHCAEGEPGPDETPRREYQVRKQLARERALCDQMQRDRDWIEHDQCRQQ